MNKAFVVDASPLIVLHKARLLADVAAVTNYWIIPEGVIAEIEVQREIGPFIRDLEKHGQVCRKRVENISPTVAGWDLGRGESEVLDLAREKNNTTALLDDLQARKCADILGIPVVGSLGLLLLAKQAGVIKAARPAIEKVIEAGLRIDDRLLDKIYARLGE